MDEDRPRIVVAAMAVVIVCCVIVMMVAVSARMAAVEKKRVREIDVEPEDRMSPYQMRHGSAGTAQDRFNPDPKRGDTDDRRRGKTRQIADV